MTARKRCFPMLLGALLMALAIPATAGQDQWDQLNQVMKDGLNQQQGWSRGWTAFFGASATVSLYLATNADEAEDRYDARVRSVTSSLGLIDTLTSPPPHADFYREYHELRRESGESEQGLHQATALLDELRGVEQSRTGWRGRVGAVIVNLGAYLAIAEGDGRRDDGLQVAGIGLLINEIKLWTEPDAAREAPGVQVGNARVPYHPQIVATARGLGVRVSF